MTDAVQYREDPDEALELTFGLGVDIEAQYEAFLLYSSCGGMDEDTATELPFPLD